MLVGVARIGFGLAQQKSDRVLAQMLLHLLEGGTLLNALRQLRVVADPLVAVLYVAACHHGRHRVSKLL
jgi:hypothetical protein